jgi:uncharacterized protein (TIGR03067 family)
VKKALLILTAGVLLAADDPVDEKVKDEVKKLQGVWVVTAVEFAGKKVEPKDSGVEQIVIKDNHIQFKGSNVTQDEIVFTVDPALKPKGMDWTKKDKSSMPGIYTVEKDELRLCFPLASTERPKEPYKRPESFETKDKLTMLLVATREKP